MCMSRKHVVGTVHWCGQRNEFEVFATHLWALPNDSKHTEQRSQFFDDINGYVILTSHSDV